MLDGGLLKRYSYFVRIEYALAIYCTLLEKRETLDESYVGSPNGPAKTMDQESVCNTSIMLLAALAAFV